MSEKVERVKISDFRVERAPAQLKISGLGSCVALAFYEPEKKIGGLAHILLPGPAPDPGRQDFSNSRLYKSKYADQAVRSLLEAMTRAGSSAGKIVAKIAGGSNMFQGPPGAEQEGPLRPGIGERNVEAVRRFLRELAIPVAGEDVGGQSGRTIVFDLHSGELINTNLQGKKLVL